MVCGGSVEVRFGRCVHVIYILLLLFWFSLANIPANSMSVRCVDYSFAHLFWNALNFHPYSIHMTQTLIYLHVHVKYATNNEHCACSYFHSFRFTAVSHTQTQTHESKHTDCGDHVCACVCMCVQYIASKRIERNVE